MRYPDTRKDETRQKVLRAAGRALREKGPDALSVAEVMQAVGLTHGGFYAHFKSKDDFLAETLHAVFAGSGQKFAKVLEGLPPHRALATYVDAYVSARHRDLPAQGCPITALNSDMPRQSKAVRAVFEAGVKRLTGALTGQMMAAGVADAESLAPSILSAMVGAIVLARAVSDPALSDELLANARQTIKARLGVADLEPSQETHG